ncbi:riboflavin synthase subunit alpha [Martelella mediterranea]|uniref:Riboflavin synthase n=1 Tax=Martelella mediterranea TaxID=293089 RepID=A0A4R3NQC2_9HYPH|nr:riboflavin synthase subunit alpha [Martelella mediterranea]TCT37650.1 riboflavin synthase alpha chain [Martelella mediterranea]
MYTGIVQAVRPLVAVEVYPGGRTFTIEFTPELLTDLKIGASVNVEGVCLSVTGMEGQKVTFDAMNATLERTNLRRFSEGDGVNVERSAKMTDENGGHVIAGHIATTAVLEEVHIADDGALIRFRVPEDWAKYIFPRGYLAVNGCSLTVAEVEDNLFTINLIPETLRQTTFSHYAAGDPINIEVDHQTMVLVDVIERTVSRVLPGLVHARD